VNYWYASTVTEGAYFAYRERFIRDKQRADPAADSDKSDEPTDAEVVEEREQ
jgi:hypothetical protein